MLRCKTSPWVGEALASREHESKGLNMTAHKPNLIPASLQRVRCFMNARGRMKVKPWSSAEETLDALHDMLVSNQREDTFWKGMESLLETLTNDMKKRLSARKGKIIDNEVLDTSRHRALLEEIRSSLDGRGGKQGRFKRLASALSMPAMGLLFILGGAVTAGCDYSSSLQGDDDADVDVMHEADSAGDSSADPLNEPECVPGDQTLEQMIGACLTDGPETVEFIECIDQMHASWRDGLEELFACEDCTQVRDWLYRCLEWRCSTPESQGEFDLDDFLSNCSVYVYLAVRFD